MTVQFWRTLCTKRYQLSLRLFLSLNAVSALFTLFLPLFAVKTLSVPALLMLMISTLLLVWHGKYTDKRINLPFISTVFGLLWALHIFSGYNALGQNDCYFLLIVLLSILFIGSTALTNNIIAFTLHSLPSVAAYLRLNGSEHGLRIFYFIALPMADIVIQHVIQKHYDGFAQQLMYKLLEEGETLSELSMLDPLTGLHSRRGLQHRLDTLLALSNSKRFVLLLDIDHSKSYDDHCGHMMGDQALIRVSAAVRDSIRSRDMVARFGGGEFMILLTAVDPQQAQAAAERTRQRVYDLKIPHMFSESVTVNVTVSISIASLVEQNIDATIAKADKALYETRNLRRNNTLVSDELRTSYPST